MVKFCLCLQKALDVGVAIHVEEKTNISSCRGILPDAFLKLPNNWFELKLVKRCWESWIALADMAKVTGKMVKPASW